MRKPIDRMISEAYTTVRTHMGYLDLGSTGYVVVRGKDALDLMHRISTGSVRDMEVGEIRHTILTNEKGRFIALLALWRTDNGLVIRLLSGEQNRVSSWIQRFIVMEEVEVTEVNPPYTTLLAIGPHVSSCFPDIPIVSHTQRLQAPIDWKSEWIEQSVIFVNPLYNRIPVVEIHLPAIYSTGVQEWLVKRAVPYVPESVFEIIRIEEGVPAPGKELDEAINPLEARLAGFIDNMKGCYIGQEVIARLQTYQKLQRELTGFVGSSKLDLHAQPAEVFQGNIKIGWISSQCWSPKYEQYLMLGYLKLDRGDGKLVARGSDGKDVDIKVISLPFTQVGVDATPTNSRNSAR